MPENPGQYKAIPPVTVVTTNAQGIVTKNTNVGSMPQVHATPTAMADPAQAARMFATLQTQTATIAAQQTSDPHTGRVIIKDQTLPAGTPTAIKHGLGRPFLGWAWNRPRTAAPTIFEVAATAAQPAKTFLILQSGVTCLVDIEVW